MMDDELLKLECLKLATTQGFKSSEARFEADRMFNLIKGRSTGEIGGGKARVVGKDNDIPFKDYKPE